MISTWAFGRQTPDNNLIRFVTTRLSWPSMFLDIGSGEGANARELKIRGHGVHTIDIDPTTDADFYADIRTIPESFWTEKFDCIYDVNTLCHVEPAPLKKIKSWLKPEGVFFSICPQFGSCSRIMQGKDFTRFLSMRDVDAFYSDFSRVKFGHTTYRLPEDDMYASWLVECRP